MSSSARAAAAYREVQVTSRSPLELVVMLYDGALDALRRASDGMRRGDLRSKRDGMKKALQIVNHLQSSLNMDEGGEIAAHLDQLYRDVVSRVLEANLRRNPAELDDAIRLLTTVRDAWASLASAESVSPSEMAVQPATAAL